MPYKLLFVCLGNICRSPSAENIMNHLIDQARLNNTILCDSAGTAGYHIGAAPDRRMSAAAENKLGFKLIGQARQFQIRDFQEFDLISLQFQLEFVERVFQSPRIYQAAV